MTVTNKPTVADFLRPYGIAAFKDFHETFGGAQNYMREVYAGRISLSKKLAIKIRTFTNGGLSADLLFSLGPENGR